LLLALGSAAGNSEIASKGEKFLGKPRVVSDIGTIFRQAGVRPVAWAALRLNLWPLRLIEA